MEDRSGRTSKLSAFRKGMRDENGVPAWMTWMFIRENLKSLGDGLKTLSQSRVGLWLPMKPLRELYRRLARMLEDSEPWAVCPYCNGLKDRCRACKGRGFVSKGFWKTCVPEEMKQHERTQDSQVEPEGGSDVGAAEKPPAGPVKGW